MSYLYSLNDALVGINEPSDKARAVVAAMERDMTTTLATKQGLQLICQEIVALRDSTARHLDNLRLRMTVQLGTMFMVGMGLLFAALRLTSS